MVQEGVSCLPEVLVKVVKNSLELEDAIASLLRYSLIERRGDDLAIHRVMQDVARDRLGQERAEEWLKIALNLLKLVFPFDKYNIKTWPTSAHMYRISWWWFRARISTW